MQKNSHKRAQIELAAGGVVFQRTPQGPLIGFILDPYRKWGLAKGHIEEGEKPEQAGRREVEEEMGIKGLKVVAPLGKTDIWFYERFRHGKPVHGPRALIHKTIYHFLMEAPRGTRGKPQRQERIHEIRWVPLRDALTTISYKNIKPILLRAIEMIKKSEQSKSSVERKAIVHHR